MILIWLASFLSVSLIGYLIYKKWANQGASQSSEKDRLTLWSQTISAAIMFSLFYYLQIFIIFVVAALWLGTDRFSSPNVLGSVFLNIALCLGALTMALIIRKAKKAVRPD